MAEPRLVVDDTYTRDGTFQLTWYFPDEGEIGGSVGDAWLSNKDVKRENVAADELESWILEHATVSLADEVRDHDGFYFATKSRAAAALRVAKAALETTVVDKPLEEWEQKALAAGWKPPSGRMKK